jgi:23S rRNA pseudouridine1911/1915/1917 synthase
MTRSFEFMVESGPKRLDQALVQIAVNTGVLADITRSRVKRLLEEQKILVNGKQALKAGMTVQSGDFIVVLSDIVSTQPRLEPCTVPLALLYEDEHILVIDKPPGLSVHPAPGTGNFTLVNALLARYNLPHLQGDNQLRPGVVHRLDKDTTGVIVVARSAQALTDLSQQFQERTVRKEYLTLVSVSSRRSNLLLSSSGTVDRPIARDRANRLRMSIDEQRGRRAVTHWEVLERSLGVAFLRCHIETGRTHQIRVHLSSLGSPLLGDMLYTNSIKLPPRIQSAVKDFGRQALHAHRLCFRHPKTTQEMEFISTPPADFLRLKKLCLSEGA